MSNNELLQRRASSFDEMLQRYASADSDVIEFLERVQPLLTAAKTGGIEPPRSYPLGAYFSNPDFSVLATRYWNHELSNCEAEFVSALRGWK